MYICATGDQDGMIDVRKAGRDGEIKNALFYVNHRYGAISYGGRVTETDTDANVTVDNCIFIGNLIGGGFVAPQTMTVTNSYVYLQAASCRLPIII